MNTDRSSENSKAATPLSQQMDRYELKKRLLISIGKVCVLCAGLHFLLWGVAFVFPSFRFVYYSSVGQAALCLTPTPFDVHLC